MKTSRRARVIRRAMNRFILEEDAPIEERRAAMDRAGKLPTPRGVRREATTLGGVRAIVATPKKIDTAGRHVLYLHGGGYTIGSPESHIGLCARLAKAAQATVTAIDYRLAPEHPYPAAIDDCVAAYRDLAGRVDPSMITVAGDSAGGGATLATLCRLRDEGDQLPACAYLLSPWTDLTASGATIATKADVDPMIRTSMIADAAAQYAGDAPLDDPGVSPLFADLTGLPPMLVQTGLDEVLLSDSTRLVERATQAGVYAELDLAHDMWHVYPAFAGFMPEADDAVLHAGRFIRAHTPDRQILASSNR